MIETAKKAIKLALKEGAKDVEVFITKNFVTTIRIASSTVIETKHVIDGGIGVRVATNKKVGFSSGNQLTPNLIKQAISIARARPPNPDFNGFAMPVKVKPVSGIYDRKLAKLTDTQAVAQAEKMLKFAVDFDSRVRSVSGALNVVTERCTIANTNGVVANDKATRILGYLTVEATNGKCAEGIGWQGSTSLREFDAETVGTEAADLTIKSLKETRKVRAGKHDIIFEPSAVGELFYHVLGYALNGREIHDKISYFADKLGQNVATDELNIFDWGNMPHGLCSKSFDDEGVPTQNTPLINKGKLVGFVYDRYYAGKAGLESTGNGIRFADLHGRGYAIEPTPYITNLVVRNGDHKRNELIADTKRGLLLSRIWYTYPIIPQIGDFSTTSRCGFLIEDGEIVSSIKQVRIHENLPKLLKNITAIGGESKQVMPWGAVASIYTPSLRFGKVRLS